MTEIFYSILPESAESAYILNKINELPEQVGKEILKYRNAKDQLRVLTGKLLLKIELDKIGIPMTGIFKGSHGKPLVSGIHFNISHSGDLVTCIISESPCGIDVEMHQNFNPDLIKKVFTDNEKRWLQSQENQTRAFYDLWTRKESVIKADGRGIYLGLDNVEVINDNVEIEGMKWKISETELLENYSCHYTILEQQHIENISEVKLF